MINFYDVMGIIGLGMLGVGLWLVAPALSLSVVGALLLAGGLLASRGRSPKRGKGS